MKMGMDTAMTTKQYNQITMNRLRIPISAFLILLSACGGGADEHGHAHDEMEGLSYTVWTDKTELFVEFKPLVVGQATSFAAHFSDMTTFRALTEGKLTVSLVQGSKGTRNTVDAPTQPGIFRPVIEPKAAGIYELWFEIETAHYNDKIVIENVEVYADAHAAIEANPPNEEDGNVISFLKEQAWKIDWAIASVRRDTVYEIIKTGGEILPSRGDEIVISATANGIVIFNLENTFVGNAVNKGSRLFTIGGGGMAANNIETEYQQAKANYDQAKSEFDRKQKLYIAKAIAKSEFEEATRNFKFAKSAYNSIALNYGSGGKHVQTTTSGFVKNIFVNEGQYVKVGDPLAVVAQNKKLTLQADVPQSEYSKLKNITSANFKMADAATAYSIDDFNGKLLSYGKSVSRDEPFIPVQFEIDNQGDVLSGSYVEMYIKIQSQGVALVVPVGALLENYGSYSLFVQTEGESFEKREITIGANDGQVVEVLSGLSEGEMVVTVGAYQVKMASMSSNVPAHGHAH